MPGNGHAGLIMASERLLSLGFTSHPTSAADAMMIEQTNAVKAGSCIVMEQWYATNRCLQPVRNRCGCFYMQATPLDSGCIPAG